MDAQARVGPQSFSALFEQYSGRIYRYLCSLVHDSPLAEDLAQDTFVKAYRAMAKDGVEPDNVSAWLYAIATNAALSALRRRRLLSWLPLGLGSEDEPWVVRGDQEEALGRRDSIGRALRELSSADAACLLLRFEHGLSFEELGVVLKCSPQAAKMRLSRARAAFREAYLRHSQEV